MKWVFYDRTHFYEKQKNSSHLWNEYKEGEIVKTFIQVLVESDNHGLPVVVLKENKNGFYLKLIQGLENSFFSLDIDDIGYGETGLWAKQEKESN